MKKIFSFVLFFLCATVCSAQYQPGAGPGTVIGVPNTWTTSCGNAYYISQSAGADSNNGTAKGTPWKHAPGMSTFVSAAGGFTTISTNNYSTSGWSLVVMDRLNVAAATYNNSGTISAADAAASNIEALK